MDKETEYIIDQQLALEHQIKKEKEEELIHKEMYAINTFQAHKNEVYLRGTDEYG